MFAPYICTTTLLSAWAAFYSISTLWPTNLASFLSRSKLCISFFHGSETTTWHHRSPNSLSKSWYQNGSWFQSSRSSHECTNGCNNEIVELLKDRGQLGPLIILRIVKKAKTVYRQVLCEYYQALFNVTMEVSSHGFFPLWELSGSVCKLTSICHVQKHSRYFQIITKSK